MFRFKRGSKGFTLVELMVVMAILAVLAGIVMPAVSGTKDVSTDSQVKTDASNVQTAAGDFFADQPGAETVTSAPALIQDLTTDQSTSNKWPELTMTAGYSAEFTAAKSSTHTLVIMDDSTTPANITATFATNYTAIDLGGLEDDNYIPKVPASFDTMAGAYHSYLWVFLKTTASGGEANASRTVAVFKMTGVTVSATGVKTLNYAQIY